MLKESIIRRMKNAQGASVFSLWSVSFRNTARVKALKNVVTHNSDNHITGNNLTCKQILQSTWDQRGTTILQHWPFFHWRWELLGWMLGSLLPLRKWRWNHPWKMFKIKHLNQTLSFILDIPFIDSTMRDSNEYNNDKSQNKMGSMIQEASQTFW